MQLNVKLSRVNAKPYLILEERLYGCNSYRSFPKTDGDHWVSLTTFTAPQLDISSTSLYVKTKVTKYFKKNNYCLLGFHRMNALSKAQKLPFSLYNSCSGYRSISFGLPINTEMFLKVFSLCRACHFTRWQPRCQQIRLKY